MARMEGVEKWLGSGSILTGFGNKMDMPCDKRNSRARTKISRTRRMERPSTEKTKTARGACLERERGGGQEFGLEHGDVE